MYNEKLYEDYQTQLREAMTADENATTALQRGKNREAASLYDQAAALYAAAAATLLDAGEACEAAERADIERSVDRLIETSRELKAYAVRVARKSDTGAGTAQNAPVGDDDAEDTRFTPIGTVPEVTFDDIAGLEEAKQLVMDEIINPLIYSELYQRFHIQMAA